jgi:hypothetical protein
MKNMTQKQADYLSYLLRLWRENGGEESQHGAVMATWRASLETPDGESYGFASLDDLVSFLHWRISVSLNIELGHSPPERQVEDVGQY